MTTPAEVFHLIERADEFVKYAQNRDPAEAFRRAREALDEAAKAVAEVEDHRARAGLIAQIDRRREDVRRLEEGRDGDG